MRNFITKTAQRSISTSGLKSKVTFRDNLWFDLEMVDGSNNALLVNNSHVLCDDRRFTSKYESKGLSRLAIHLSVSRLDEAPIDDIRECHPRLLAEEDGQFRFCGWLEFFTHDGGGLLFNVYLDVKAYDVLCSWVESGHRKIAASLPIDRYDSASAQEGGLITKSGPFGTSLHWNTSDSPGVKPHFLRLTEASFSVDLTETLPDVHAEEDPELRDGGSSESTSQEMLTTLQQLESRLQKVSSQVSWISLVLVVLALITFFKH